jgi:malate/lactate dehydrogenase
MIPKRKWLSETRKMKKTISKLKKELDKVFSLYIRHLYAVDGVVECYTCFVKKTIKEMQNGHMQSRKHISTRWHENNCRPQCVKCNIYSEGEKIRFYKRLCSEIGEQEVEEIIQLSYTTQKLSRYELQEMIDYYKNQLKKIS